MQTLRFASLGALCVSLPASARQGRPFDYMDVFGLGWAADPQICPDGGHVAYVRTSGEEDLRTPVSESYRLFHALERRKVADVLAWFERYRQETVSAGSRR